MQVLDHWDKLAVDSPFCYTQNCISLCELDVFSFLYKAERSTHARSLFPSSLTEEKHSPAFAKLFRRV